MNKAESAIRNSKKELENKKNTVGLGTGIKESNGQLLDKDDPSILVIVNKKESKHSLHKDELIPEEIDGVKTDVIEANIQPLSKEKYVRPFMQGDEIGVDKSTRSGTLGCIFRWNGADYGLTNWHVVWKGSPRPEYMNVVNYKVTQPGGGVGRHNWITEEDGSRHLSDNLYIIGEVVRYVTPEDGICDAALFEITIDTTDPKKPYTGWNAVGSVWDNQVDRMIREWPNIGYEIPLFGFPHYHNEFNCRIRSGNSESDSLRMAGGFAEPKLGDKVWKSGKTTGVTHGTVISLDMTTSMNYSSIAAMPFYCNMKNQILITKDKSANYDLVGLGDSGSCFVSQENFINSLLFAGDSNYCVATSIQTVLKELFTQSELSGYNINSLDGWKTKK